MAIWLPIYYMLTHWFGDFIFQTNDMANNKSKSLYWLTIHVLAYGSAIIMASLILYFFKEDVTFIEVVKFSGINIGLHWLTDLITSKLARYFKTKGNIRLYYCTIGFDQFIHASILIYTSNTIFLN